MADENIQENQEPAGAEPSAPINNPAWGRKVFFLNPTYMMRDNIITNLWNEEYEVYLLYDYQYTKSMLKKNPDTLLFINIDVKLNFFAWYAFVESIRKDPDLQSTIVGIVSDKFAGQEKDLFLTRTKCDAGFLSTVGSISSITHGFRSVMDMYGAKGRRQYVRAMCLGIQASMLCQTADKMFELPLVDISRVSCSVKLEERFFGYIKAGTILSNVTLKLNGKVIPMEVVVYAVHKKDNAILAVLLFPKNLSPLNQDSIKDFIFNILQKTLKSSINGEQPDTTDYTGKGVAVARELQAEKQQKKMEEKRLEAERLLAQEKAQEAGESGQGGEGLPSASSESI